MPLVAMFILFDFVIHNPIHPETQKNLAFLDIAAGYFSRMDLVSEGCLNTSLLAGFTHIARKYVSSQEEAATKGLSNNPRTNDIRECPRNAAQQNMAIQGTGNQPSPGQSVDEIRNTSEPCQTSSVALLSDFQVCNRVGYAFYGFQLTSLVTEFII